MNYIESYQKKTIEQINTIRSLPEFQVGDTVIIKYKDTIFSTNQRIQSYQGVVISKNKRGLSSSFTVRKISFGEGVNKNFMYYSQNILDIQILRKAKIRRAKLYYISRLKGKAARLKERITQKI